MRKIESAMRNGAGTNPVPFLQRIEKNTDTSVGSDLFSRAASSRVSSALMSLTAVFGMGTGGPSSLQALTFGAPSGIRTRDPLIKSQLLYQLS